MPGAALLAAALAATGLLLASPVSALLARARWTRRAPLPALVLWQAVCLAAGVSVVGAGVVLAVQPLGHNVVSGVWRWFTNLTGGHPLAGQSEVEVVVGALASAAALALFAVLLLSLLRAVRRRRAHRALLDLLTAGRIRTGQPAGGAEGMPTGDRADLLAGVRIVDHRAAVAYTLPGWHSRVVLTAGLLELLDRDELAAVIGHERAHIRFRHDLLVLPFQAWATALGRLPGVRGASTAVADLAEMLADDLATGACERRVLARALAKVALSGDAAPDEPTRAIAAGPVAARVDRLLEPAFLPRWQVVAVYLAAAALLVVPTVMLLRGWR